MYRLKQITVTQVTHEEARYDGPKIVSERSQRRAASLSGREIDQPVLLPLSFLVKNKIRVVNFFFYKICKYDINGLISLIK